MTGAHILTIRDRKEEKFLRRAAVEFDFSLGKKELGALIARMRETMRRANGIGLSANQIGLPWNIFVAEVPDAKGGSKFYAVFNPKIEKVSEEASGLEEGCLSVPGTYGEVKRPERITIRGLDRNKKKIRIKAWGLLARVFQHEIDHLNGKLFVDKAKNLHDVPESERLRKREEKLTND